MWAQAKVQPRENCQAVHTVSDDLEPQLVILYGVPQSFDAPLAPRVQHEIAQLQVSICEAYRAGIFNR